MKTLKEYLNRLPEDSRRRIADGAARKIAAINLQHVREAAGLTQEDMAKRLGVNQASLSRMEHRPDVRINNIRRYVEAAGGKLTLTAIISGHGRSRKIPLLPVG